MSTVTERNARDELLRPVDFEAEYGVSTGTQKTWRKTGVGPKWFRLGARRVVYRRSEIEAWIAESEKAAAS